jgi:hypothetical protein
MIKIFIFLFLLSLPCMAATLTTGYTPVVAQGGSTPQLQNASIYDTGTTNGPGNVGINNTNPLEALQVGGEVQALGFVETGITPTAASGASFTYACFNKFGVIVSSTSAC